MSGEYQGVSSSVPDATVAGSSGPERVRTEVASFAIERISYLDADGTPLGELPDFVADREAVVGLHRAMTLTRVFDAKAVSLQRTGRLGTFASSLGQEAVAVGVGAAMRSDDVLVPSFREQGAQFMRGVTPVELLLYWGGDERGSDFSGPREDFPITVPIGTHVAHGVGVALALQLRNESRAVVCVMGDGATSRGDVYASMNYAGVRSVPVVFVVNNNQWAISVPRSRQTAAATLAQKAVGVGMRGEQVDGNDVIAVRDRVETALDVARSGGGPTLIEAVTYRLADHTTADDASRYRDDEEVSAQWARDPLNRLRAFLVATHGWSRDEEEALVAGCRDRIEAAADEYLAVPVQPAASMFDNLYEQLPEPLHAQRAELIRQARRTDE